MISKEELLEMFEKSGICAKTSPAGKALSTISEETTQRFIALLPAHQAQGELIGEAGVMPGTAGFTMACFKASDVPVGAKLYTAPRLPAQTDSEDIRNQVWNEAVEAAAKLVEQRKSAVAKDQTTAAQWHADAIRSLKRPHPQEKLQAQEPCRHSNSKYVYESGDGEFERHECPDCGARFGVEIPQ